MTNSNTPNNSNSKAEEQQNKPTPKPNKIPPPTPDKAVARNFDIAEFGHFLGNKDDVTKGNKD
jgi:hypothetical protein